MSDKYLFLYKYDGIIFLLFQILLFFCAFNSSSRIITILFLSYFYYSTFTGWHECVHREKSFKKDLSFNSILGAISISPLILLSYQKKFKLHLNHHGYTNDPKRDPDYNINNLQFFKNKKKSTYSTIKFSGKLNLIEILFKILFIFLIIIWCYQGKSIIDFSIGYFLGNFLMHLLVNIYPHFKTNNKYGRNLGGNKLITFFLFSNNLHGFHHYQPHLPWWKILISE